MKQPIQITFERCPGYLRATCEGTFPTDCRESLQRIRAEALRSENTLVLLDCYGLSEPASEMARFDAGVALAEIFGHHLKVAVLYDPAHINKFAENVAVNRGTEVLVIGDPKAALLWLLGKEPDPAPVTFPT
jgi:hypothetical protein